MKFFIVLYQNSSINQFGNIFQVWKRNKKCPALTDSSEVDIILRLFTHFLNDFVEQIWSFTRNVCLLNFLFNGPHPSQLSAPQFPCQQCFFVWIFNFSSLTVFHSTAIVFHVRFFEVPYFQENKSIKFHVRHISELVKIATKRNWLGSISSIFSRNSPVHLDVLVACFVLMKFDWSVTCGY